MDGLFSEAVIPADTSVAAPTGLSTQTQSLIDKFKALRGPNDRWGDMENATSRYIANLTNNDNVWCRGEVHAKNHHYPAVVVFKRDTRTLVILAPSGEDFAMEEYPPQLFSSNIPHIGTCREVFSKTATTVTV